MKRYVTPELLFLAGLEADLLQTSGLPDLSDPWEDDVLWDD